MSGFTPEAERPYTYSQEYLMTCMARRICAMPTKARRKDFLVRVRKRHGSAAADDLERRVKEEWRKGYGR